MRALGKTRSISGVRRFWTAAVAFVLLVCSLEPALSYITHPMTDEELQKLCEPLTPGSTTHASINVKDLGRLFSMVKAGKDAVKGMAKSCKTNYFPKLVGWADEQEFKTPFHHFTEAYHTLGIPAVSYWTETIQMYQDIRPPLVHIRTWQRNYDHLVTMSKKCEGVYNEAGTFNLPLDKNNGLDPDVMLRHKCETIAHRMYDCLNDEIFLDVHPDNTTFLNNFHKACYLQFDLLMKAFIYSAQPLTYNGRKPSWDYSPFGIMFKDTTEYDIGVKERVETTFPQYIDQLIKGGKAAEGAELQKKLDEIKARLANTSLPYHKIYYKGDVKRMAADRIDGASFIFNKGKGKKGVAPFLQQVLDIYSIKTKAGMTLEEHMQGWRKDIKNFVTDFNDKVAKPLPQLAGKIISVYKSYVNVDALPTGTGSPFGGVLINDGEYDWDYEKNGIHNMRLAWDLMGAVLEELKCYMKETYYFDLRQKALADTQQDLKKATLYSDISTTMFYPCRIDYNNESDLVTGHCTKENHEICSPMAPFHQQQRPESRYHGGLALLRPRWIYKYSEQEKKCVGRRDYVMLMSVCRCGFRMDCGDDLGVNITCQLRNNDVLRGQCRGTVGYPCMSLPLATGMRNESCISGYCNAYQNSCEDAPAMPYGTSRGAPVCKVDRAKSAWIFVVLAVALIAFKCQQIAISL